MKGLSRPNRNDIPVGVSVGLLRKMFDSQRRVECFSQMVKPLELVGEAVSFADVKDNRYLYVNTAWVKLYGYPAKQALGKNMGRLINSPDISKGILRTIKIQALKGCWEGFLGNRNKKGQKFTVSLRTACLTDSDNNALGLMRVATVIDDEVADGRGVYRNGGKTQRKSNAQALSKKLEQLTPREMEVFALFGQGLNTRQVAEKLGISVYTVQTHRNHMRKKLDVGNSTELNLMAFKSMG